MTGGAVLAVGISALSRHLLHPTLARSRPLVALAVLAGSPAAQAAQVP